MTEMDTKPWYRHFYPWLVIVLLGAAVSGSLYTLHLAVTTAEPVLQEYKDQR